MTTPVVVNLFNTSARAGFLTPVDTASFLADDELENFVQTWVAGVSGIDPTLVRPSYQANPPSLPDASVTWCGVYVKLGPVSWDAAKRHVVDATGAAPSYDSVFKVQEVRTVCTFYGPKAGLAAMTLNLGAALPQNREPLQQKQFGFVSVEEPTTVAEKINGVFQRRVDTAFLLRRSIQFSYAVRDLEAPASPNLVALDLVAVSPEGER